MNGRITGARNLFRVLTNEEVLEEVKAVRRELEGSWGGRKEILEGS